MGVLGAGGLWVCLRVRVQLCAHALAVRWVGGAMGWGGWRPSNKNTLKPQRAWLALLHPMTCQGPGACMLGGCCRPLADAGTAHAAGRTAGRLAEPVSSMLGCAYLL